MTLTLAGEWILRSTATGKPGGAKVEYAPGGSPTSTTIVLTLVDRRSPGARSLTTQQLLTQKGFVLPLPGIGEIAIGEDPRAIGGDAASAPELAANGTVAAGAVDVVRVTASRGEPHMSPTCGSDTWSPRPWSPSAASSAASR